MPLEQQVSDQFRARQYLGLPASDAAQFVAVYYPEGDMLITGEGREMPPFLLFHAGRILVSGDGKEWQDITEDSGGLAALALLDPRRVINGAEAAAIEGEDKVTVDLRKLLENAGVTTDDVGEAKQLVEFELQNGIVKRMVQNDLSGSAPPVTIRFVAEPVVTLPA